MQIGRAPLLIILGAIIGAGALLASAPSANAQSTQQRLVESVDIQGNRRNREEDLLYYVNTKPETPFSPEQAQRDLQTLLALGFFNKANARVEVEDAADPRAIHRESELPQGRFDGLPLRVENALLRADEHRCLHRSATFGSAR